MARFEPLTNYLEQYDGDAVILTFDEVESLSGARLPRSARKAGSSFWNNSPRNIYARHWMAAGFEAGFEDCAENEICFARAPLVTDDEPLPAPPPGWEPDPPQPPPSSTPAPPPPAPPPPAPAASADPSSTLPPPPADRLATLPPPPAEVTIAADAARLARELSDSFTLAQADLLQRRDAPAPGWGGLPDVQMAVRLRAGGTDDVWVRLVLTFGALLDRGRQRPEVWTGVEQLFADAHDTFEPAAVASRSLGALATTLRDAGLTDRLTDVAGWRLLAEVLADGSAPALTTTVHVGLGDAAALTAELAGDAPPVPALARPKAFHGWLRSLVHPGGVTLAGLGDIGVTVDGDVRRATELLGLSPAGLRSGDAVPRIEQLWTEAAAASPPAGPPGLKGTPLALEQALRYHGRVGCRWCRAHTRIEPIGPACESCILRAAERTA